jgi:1-phosphofructokinase family hexose kinase
MIVCVSANPAIDRRLRLESIAVGDVNRAVSAHQFPGGKAAHVAMAAHSLGEAVMWVGFLGGATGEECESGLSDLGIPVTIVRTLTQTRSNLEIIADDGKVTEILEPGGVVTESEVERLLSACRDIFAEGDEGSQVALSGSLPPGVPTDFYAELIRLAHAHGWRALLDSSGGALRQGIEAKPDLVKPNRNEAAWFGGRPVSNARVTMEIAREMFEAGAHSVAVSLGVDGVIWQPSPNSQALVAQAPPLAARSTVGCGDAALAGFAVAHARGLSEEEIVGLAVACGTANCLAEAPGMIDRGEVERIMQGVSVKRLHAGYPRVETKGAVK